MKRSMVVSLIGRPNVGKSSIFNRVMGRGNRALTYDEPGVTRDRHYGMAALDDLADEDPTDIILVDTGGFYPERIDERGKNQEEENKNKFFNIMTDHAKLAISESDLILFVVDVREGLIPFDQIIADYLRSQKKEAWLLINKYDSDNQAGEEGEFYSLGVDYEDMILFSAEHGLGSLDLKRRLHKRAVKFANEEDSNQDLQKGITPREEVAARLAIIGVPNAGKSTLLNKLVGSERALVSNIPGTTVDPIEGFFDLYFGRDALELSDRNDDGIIKNNQLLLKQYDSFRKNNPDVYHTLEKAYQLEESRRGQVVQEDVGEEDFGKGEDALFQEVFEKSDDVVIEEKKEEGSFWRSIHIVDTAGIRKQKLVHEYVESQSVFRSLRSVSESDIVVAVVDAEKGIGHQDRRLIDISLEKGKSVIVCLNKVDLLKERLKDDKAKREWIKDLRDKIPWLDYCDVIPMSAKYGKHIKDLKKSIMETVLVRRRKIPTGELNRHLFQMTDRHSVSINSGRGKRLKIKYASMVKTNPPTFLMFVNRSDGIPDNYRKYLQNGLRSEFRLFNTPVHLIFRTGRELK